jgi:carboxylesterase type B
MNNVKKLQIPHLGEVQGIYDIQNGITRFLGIPYGVVSKRWTRPGALTHFPDGTHDGTKPGSAHSQTPLFLQLPG